MYIIKEKTTARLIAWFQKPDCLSSINKIMKLVSAGFDQSQLSALGMIRIFIKMQIQRIFFKMSNGKHEKEASSQKKKKSTGSLRNMNTLIVTDKAGVAEGLNKLFALTFMKEFGAHP